MAGHHATHQASGRRFSPTGTSVDALPTGSCDFRDLSLGSSGPKCGCNRFWLNIANVNAQDGGSQRAWCFCGHHACFHNAFGSQRATQESGQIIGDSRTVDIDQQDHAAYISETISTQPLRSSSAPSKPPAGLGIRPDSRSQGQSINTRVWQALNNFAREQDETDSSDTHSRLLSTAPASLIEDSRLSPNRILQDRLQLYRPMGPPVNIPQASAAPRPAEEYSATEVATPSIAGTPDFRALAASSSPSYLRPGLIRSHASEPSRHDATTLPAASPAEASIVRPTIENPLMSARDTQTMLASLARRLDVIENMSFSQAQIEELQERFDLFDGRLIDLEQWRTDQEQAQSSPEPPAVRSNERRHLPSEKGSFESHGSFDLSAAAQTEAVVLATLAANAETSPRIDDLNRRVSELEARSLPSFGRPWQVQVVFLPWGRDLHGIWFSSQESSLPSLRSTMRASEEWTFDQSLAPSSFSTSFGAAWTTESIEAWASEAEEWLSPKACGPKGMVFQRLQSRGFIHDVEFKSSDSRHILDILTTAFAHVTKSIPQLETVPNSHQGLREKIIPLRKVRKSSRLRFLSQAEMVTSASWTASFLDSSVFMKVSDDQRRLYITSPDAYLQPAGPSWTWDKIRALPIFDASPGEQAARAEHKVIEACWTYNHALDQLPSSHSSFSSHESQWSIRSQYSKGGRDVQKMQPISPRSETQLLHRRTVSLTSAHLAGESSKEVPPKRRVASFETIVSSAVPLEIGAWTGESSSKRRRLSNSPGIERRGVNFTPRWSREPPSPFASSELAADIRSQGVGSRKRGGTPFAYNTPHSNSNIVQHLDSLLDGHGGDGDTEADTELPGQKPEPGEEEWHGVEDDSNSVVHIESSGSAQLARNESAFEEGSESEEEDGSDDEDEDMSGDIDDDLYIHATHNFAQHSLPAGLDSAGPSTRSSES